MIGVSTKIIVNLAFSSPLFKESFWSFDNMSDKPPVSYLPSGFLKLYADFLPFVPYQSFKEDSMGSLFTPPK